MHTPPSSSAFAITAASALVLTAVAGAAPARAAATGATDRAGVSVVGTSTAPATAARGSLVADVNGDGLPDIVHGSHRYAGDDCFTGSLVVLYGGERLPQQRIDADDLKAPRICDTFASDVITADLDRDGYADVVASDAALPGYEENAKSRVWVLWGSPSGISAARSAVLVTGPMLLGRALAYVPGPTPVLAIAGADRVGGSVRLYRVRANGSLGRHRILGLASRGIAGSAVSSTPDDVQFGFALAAAGRTLVIGAPEVKIGRVPRAGAAYVLRMGTGLTYRAVRVSQAGRAVPGAPERRDRFGWAVSVHQGYVAVGVPGEAIGEMKNAGQVQVFRVRPGSRLSVRHVRTASQTTLGIAGVTSARSRLWGDQVAVYRPCTGAVGVLVTGGIWVKEVVSLPLTHAESCPARVLALGAYNTTHDIGILRTTATGTTAESTWFTVPGGFRVTAPDGTSTLWPWLP